MSEKKSVAKDMMIGELVEKHPESAEVMFGYGLHCIGCHVAGSESIEQGAKAHGMSNEDINKMVKEINEAINKPKEKEPEIEAKPIEEKKEEKKGFLKRIFGK